jgi:ribulose-bisphosphate carboxylase small chain
MFDLRDAAGVLMELAACRKSNPDSYIKLIAFDSTRGFETVRTSFIVNRPKVEPSFALTRTEVAGRTVNIALTARA